MKHGSLFNGIGGFQLAAQWMGWENIMSCEIDEFCSKVTKYHFPNCIQHGDIKTTDFSIYRGRIDVLTGGFPCQPYSAAGKRKGKEDDRHLWPEMLRAIREVSPRWVVGENVRGLTNWNGGLVFDEVQSDLETEGYEVTPFLLPACAVNAPHRRDRIWFIAYAVNNRHQTRRKTVSGKDGIQSIDRQTMGAGESNGTNISTDTSNTNKQGAQGSEKPQSITGIWQDNYKFIGGRYQFNNWSVFPTQSPICRRDDGISNRVDRIKALGNAIVPQVAYQIFKAIQSFNDSTRSL